MEVKGGPWLCRPGPGFRQSFWYPRPSSIATSSSENAKSMAVVVGENSLWCGEEEYEKWRRRVREMEKVNLLKKNVTVKLFKKYEESDISNFGCRTVDTVTARLFMPHQRLALH